ncbi:MAG TPA: PQQ-dependent sugar dehydrogenase [Armatimonadota bacterium]|jgi:glucose/arabinose dehydrogenase
MLRYCVLAIGLLYAARAATVPTGFADAVYASGLSAPTAMDFAPDGRLFVCQQTGSLRVIKDGALLPNPFVSIAVSSAGERGLLGVAFDPGFASNHYVYVYHTTAVSPIHNRIVRYTADGDVAAPGSAVVLMDLDNLSAATNHNGGAIHFGLDGKLYVGVGENANGTNSQTLTNRLGKLLRINSDGSIPEDNPFYNTAAGANRAIWAMGLRNPFTFAIQPGSGRIFINDVGQSTWEEIDDGIAGSNYGWPAEEGFADPPNPAYRDPLYVYNHNTGAPTGCAITGGAFYNPSTPMFPTSYTGRYFFADNCGGWIYSIDPAAPSTSTLFATGIPSPVDLKVGPDGALYYLAQGSGSVGRISHAAPISLADAERALRITAGLETPAPADISRLNVVPDGVVNIADAIRLARQAAGTD